MAANTIITLPMKMMSKKFCFKEFNSTKWFFIERDVSSPSVFFSFNKGFNVVFFFYSKK